MMNAENILTELKAMLKEYDKASESNVTEKLLARPNEWVKSFIPFYASAAKLVQACKDEISAKANKAQGGTSARMSALKKYLKTSLASYQRALNGMFEDKDGKFVICDGHRLIRLKADIESFTHIDTERLMPFDTANMIKQTRASVDFSKPIKLPEVAKLKAFVAENKGKELVPCVFYAGEKLVAYNPQFLIDLQNALPNAKHYADANGYIYSETEDGEDAFTLKVALKNQTEPNIEV